MKYIELLQKLISTPSLSKNEGDTAIILRDFLISSGVRSVNGLHNNVWCVNSTFDSSKPTLLLCSHHDTVAPSNGYTRNPYRADIEDGNIYGLGANDAGGSVCALTAAFLNFYDKSDLKYNLVLALVGEEECSGDRGLAALLPSLPDIDCAIIGEPTKMEMAIAERGLLVMDCVAQGRSGHAARNEGLNAIYVAMQDIAWVATYQFDRLSPLFGSVKMTTTIIGGGEAHNVVPDRCTFTIDARVTEQYSLQEVFDTVEQHLTSSVTPRSMRLNPSSIALSHPLIQSGLSLGLSYYGSPTTSDAAQLPGIPTLKLGPGDSARSHTADEFLSLTELSHGISTYTTLLSQFILEK